MPDTKRYLDPDVLARLRGLELRARRVVAGFISGMHRSAYHGFSVEFAEHRQYVPGDDLRYIDWRILGRSDRLYIKEYEEETNLRCNLLVDASRSMAYGGANSQAGTKFEYAGRLAASLAYLLTSQQDAPGLILFDREVRQRLPEATGRAHLTNLVHILEQAEPARDTDVRILFHRLAEELRHRSMVVLISDLCAPAPDVLSGIEHICHAGHELILLHVLDDDEWEFPFVENILFEGLEDELRLFTDPQSLRTGYLEALRKFSDQVRSVCLKHRADYVPVNTRDPLDVVLSGYLARRNGLIGSTR